MNSNGRWFFVPQVDVPPVETVNEKFYRIINFNYTSPEQIRLINIARDMAV